MIRTLVAWVVVLVLGSSSRADNGLERVRKHEPKMSYLDNGVIRLGVDLNLGGSVTYLSRSGSDRNLVNGWDFGRQIQMSYYSGPVPFEPGGKKPKPEWNFIGWNPIQVGDAFGNPSRVLEQTNDGKRIYVKCVPMHWPLDGVPGECTYECWFELEGSAVHARSRIVNDRPDHTQYPARGQELPAVYTNGPWYRLVSYTGDKPFTNAPVTRIEKRNGDSSPWSTWTASESWAALLDDSDFGLGVFEPGTVQFSGGFAGTPGNTGPHDDPTGYIAPNRTEILDWNITHEYRYDLIVGKLADIRQYVNDHAPRPAPPAYNFEHDRQGWSYAHASDAGWPIKGELSVKLEENDPQIVGPLTVWPADRTDEVVIEAASHAESRDARLFWRRLGDEGFADSRSAAFDLINDGGFHTYRVKLAGRPDWNGTLLQLRLDPVSTGRPGEWIRIKSILCVPKSDP